MRPGPHQTPPEGVPVYRHQRATAPQLSFWKSKARYRLLAGGVGSGKTRIGILEALAQPKGSRGVILAPTYGMLQDATIHTFLELANGYGLLRHYVGKPRPEATLTTGVNILFRSAEKPDHLRGPNLGWFYLDELAQMDEEVWRIMLGRLRRPPMKAWGTGTPRGFNWVYNKWTQRKDYNGSSYKVFYAPTRSNTFLPEGYLESLEEDYPAQYKLQELEGQFIELSGGVFKREWFESTHQAPPDTKWARYYDLAVSLKTTASRTATCAVGIDSEANIYIKDMTADRMEWPEQKAMMHRLMLAEPDTIHGIEEALHGTAALQELSREPDLAHVHLRGVKVTRDKLTRALPWAARAEQGRVYLVDGAWVDNFMIEALSFDGSGKGWDDQVDAVSGAYELLRYAQAPASVSHPIEPARRLGGRMLHSGRFGPPIRRR